MSIQTQHNPITVMLAEHDVILRTEKMILNLDGMWENDAPEYERRTGELLVFFKEYADGFHHKKEEDILFSAIVSHPDFTLPELIDEFETHHEDFRDYLSEVSEALDNGDYALSYKTLTSYLNDLLDHIGAENDELFSMAENLLDEHEMEQIYFRFKDLDLELGEARKKELERQLE